MKSERREKPTRIHHEAEIEAERQYLTNFDWVLNDWTLLYDCTYSQSILSDSFPLDGLDDCTCQLSLNLKNLENPLAIEFSDTARILAMAIRMVINYDDILDDCYLRSVPTTISPAGIKFAAPLEKSKLKDVLNFESTDRKGCDYQTISLELAITKTPESHCLLYKKPLTSVVKNMKAMFENKTHCDVRFVFDDKEIPAHKGILAVQSAVFEAMFSTEMKEKDTNKVEIVDINAETFEEFLKYLYIGEVDDLKNIAEEMLVVADKYQVFDLKKLCENDMMRNLRHENVVNYLLFAEEHSCTALKKKALDLFDHSVNSSKRAITNENLETIMRLKELFSNVSVKEE